MTAQAHGNFRSRNSALFFPRLQIADPNADYRPRSFGNSGTMAGVFARTDSDRGVWKAPAGIEATLRGIDDLDYRMTDAENGTLNPLAINALRVFPIYGLVSWGARTLDGADQTGSDARIDALVAERAAARAAKDFATSDRIRDELAAEGIEVVDTATGATWRRR